MHAPCRREHDSNKAGLASPSGADKPLNLEIAVGRARVGHDAVRWPGVPTLRAHAREQEQRGQRAVARLNRVLSAVIRKMKVVVGKSTIDLDNPAAAVKQIGDLGLNAR